jgi:hypothetical protein
MRIKKAGALLAACVSCAMIFSGCSVTDFFDRIMGITEEEKDSSAESVQQEEVEVKEIDTSLELPVFSVDLTGSTQIVSGSEYNLTVEASVSDGGTLSYQWYSNSVNANGGGTPIEGADGDSCQVDTSEAGITYYYVVVTNNQGDHIRMATSGVREIHVWGQGTWQQDETGGWRYVLEDGTYPANTWIEIEGQTYHMDENGYRAAGWYQEGDNAYYFNEGGELQRNTTTPDGYTVNENGVRI